MTFSRPDDNNLPSPLMVQIHRNKITFPRHATSRFSKFVDLSRCFLATHRRAVFAPSWGKRGTFSPRCDFIGSENGGVVSDRDGIEGAVEAEKMREHEGGRPPARSGRNAKVIIAPRAISPLLQRPTT